MRALSVVGVLSLMSLRNILSHKVKSAIVGFIMLFGTFLVVLGTSLLDSIDKSMAKSITGSIAGHLQVYDVNARDKLALFGSMSLRREDTGRILDYSVVKRELSKLDNVEAVIPMGLDWSVVIHPGETDRTLERLRDAVNAGDLRRAAVLGERVRQLAGLLSEELEATAAISADKERITRGREVLAKARSEELWADLESKPLEVLEFLDTEVAPLSEDGKMIYLRYLGTDLDLFAENFDRFQIVDGQMVPSGERGFLFNKKMYEEQIKNRVASELDFIRRNVVEQDKPIASDPILQAKVKQLPRQYRRVTHQLDSEESETLQRELVAALGPAPGGEQETLEGLVQRLLSVNEENIAARHALFYSLVAPKIQLYEVPVGDTLTLRAFTKSGYMKAVNVKVYGTFEFRGLERSDLAGGHNLVDMASFRELYGYLTDEKKQELDQIRGAVGTQDVDRESAEAALFGGGGEVQAERREAGGFDEFAGTDLGVARRRAEELAARKLTQEEIDRGIALNAAIVLEDPARLEETRAAISALSKEKGLELQIVDWKVASDVVGQFMLLIRGVLYVAIGIIFTVALVIINNSMITATMERVTEIGTMRAIGAQRRFVLSMFLLETLILGILSGGLGAALGAGAVRLLGQVGIAAQKDVEVFLYAGPRLYPELGVHNLVIGFVLIMVVSLVSTLYPARIATQIQPVVAMQRKE